MYQQLLYTAEREVSYIDGGKPAHDRRLCLSVA